MLAAAVWALQPGLVVTTEPPASAARAAHPESIFTTADNCVGCHNRLTSPSGEDVSIGTHWRASMMALSARDPYFQASVRREIVDHGAADVIEDECTTCHAPMSHTLATAAGNEVRVLPHAAGPQAANAGDPLTVEGVSCTLCHQIRPDRLGTAEAANGGFVIDATLPLDARPLFGPFAIHPGRATIMRSATGFTPTEAPHVSGSEFCATCHTLYTTALGPNGEVLGKLPEQTPHLEWLHSAFRGEQTCQSCHMPRVAGETPIASVLGPPRAGMSRHVFFGGNVLMLRMLDRRRGELGIDASPAELDRAARGTAEQLRTAAAISFERIAAADGRLAVDVVVTNLAGHKLPTAYPSRRTWLHLLVRDADGRPIFESGRLAPDGRIIGNDNDADASRYEPHYAEIRAADDVQIYESIMADPRGAVTTGLLNAVRYIKDNRLLPSGFDKATAAPDIAVQGDAAGDGDFRAGGDRVRYVIQTGSARRPFDLSLEMLYQPIAYRWAHNLRPYDAAEPRRFVRYFETAAAESAVILARAAVSVP